MLPFHSVVMGLFSRENYIRYLIQLNNLNFVLQ